MSTLYRGLHLGLFVKYREERRGNKSATPTFVRGSQGETDLSLRKAMTVLEHGEKPRFPCFPIREPVGWCVEQRKTDHGYVKELVFPARIAGKNFSYNVDR